MLNIKLLFIYIAITHIFCQGGFLDSIIATFSSMSTLSTINPDNELTTQMPETRDINIEQDTSTENSNKTKSIRNINTQVIDLSFNNIKKLLKAKKLTIDMLEKFYNKLNNDKALECEINLTNKNMQINKLEQSIQDSDTNKQDTNEETTTIRHAEPAQGILGGLEVVTNLGGIGKNAAGASFICYIRAPLILILGLLDQLIIKTKQAQGPETFKKRNQGQLAKKIKNGQTSSWMPNIPDKCDCSGFGTQDPSVSVQTLRTLEAVVLILRQLIKTLDIVLITPFGGLCKNRKNDFGLKIGKNIANLVPFSVVG